MNESFKSLLDKLKSKGVSKIFESNLDSMISEDQKDDFIIFLIDNGIEVLNDENSIDDCDDITIDNDANISDSVRFYLNEICTYKMFSADEEREAFIKYNNSFIDEKEKRKIKEEIFSRNLRLVLKAVKWYKNRGSELLDLIQEGNIGLYVAIDKFDVSMGYKFSTYAMWWIRQYIKRSILKDGKIVIPSHIDELIAKIKLYKGNYFGLNSRFPSDDEIMNEFNISSENMLLINNVMSGVSSLNAPVGEEDSSELGDFIADTDDDCLTAAIKSEDKEYAASLLNKLSEKEQMIIRARYGLPPYASPLTLTEIGDILALSKERIRQLESKALKKLRLFYQKDHEKDFSEEKPDNMLIKWGVRFRKK